ncbi:MAG: carboxypeptidase-like regulatory domain-containing protein [Cytophagales bacterium]|nr:carboxypeptidase-like regulatory domain-containing protein [Cytophagales bacterium]
MRSYQLYWGCLLFSCTSLFAQTSKITGTLSDSQTGQPIPFAHIFINNTSLGTTSNEVGNFVLLNAPVGATEIIFSSVGYETHRKIFTLTEGQTLIASVQLTPALQELNQVEIKSTRDKTWLKQLKQFEKVFFGSTYASSCKILNPWVLEFAQGDSKAFSASAMAPLEIVNSYLGYTILFHLKKFQTGNFGYVIDGNAYFQEIENATKSKAWQENRQQCYEGSERHLVTSLLKGTTEQAGFKLYRDKPGVANVNVRSNVFYAELDKKIIAYDLKELVATTNKPYEYVLKLNGRTEVHYLKRAGRQKYYKDITGAVSWIEVRDNQIRVNNFGNVLNPADVTYSGELSEQRVGNLLPLNYEPVLPSKMHKEPTRQLPIEKAYVHTDKPYYYPNETIWMKAYLNYSNTQKTDTLSQVLYQELIDSRKHIVLSQMVKIDSGQAISQMRLPATLPPGDYLLRSYTNWMLNFGEPCFSIKPIPVLALSEKIIDNSTPAGTRDSLVWIDADKARYRTREQITLTIHVHDEQQLPARASLSVAVTDARQVARIKSEETIVTAFESPTLSRPALLAYPIDNGIVVNGRFTNARNKPESTNLLAVVGTYKDLLSVPTDKSGLFTLNGLQFTDTLQLTFIATDKWNKPYGNVTLTSRTIPEITSWKTYPAELRSFTEFPQRVFTNFELATDARLLDDVIVTSTRIAEPSKEIQHKFFGLPDHTVKGDVLANSGTTNLAVALQGKVPGLVFIPAIGDRGATYKINIRGVSSILLNTEPLVLVDGVPVGGGNATLNTTDAFGKTITGSMGDTAGDKLAMLDPNAIDRVEVTTRVNSLYGDAGRNGVIAVFTKAGAGNNRLMNLESKNAGSFKITGYSKPAVFQAPNYNSQSSTQPDYRSTLYWNPAVRVDDTTGTAVISFFASDNAGRYRVVVEGVSESGVPLRYESILTIDE